MSKAIQICLKTTELLLGWMVLLFLLAFCLGAIPVLCLVLFWL